MSDSDEIVYSLTRADIDAIVGWAMSEDDQDRFAGCIQWSSIPEALSTIAEQFPDPTNKESP